ncbi:MAG TPA: PAS domain S-box protein [Nitrospiraceae bacterium]|nr:PAS domain S-box protein [Nitrospiraceae bacterium]
MSPIPGIPEESVAAVLIVDDEPDIRETLSDMLVHEGYQVHAVGTGAAAVQQASQIRYAAVLLDIGLPDLDGHAVLKILSEMDANLPVIIVTGQATEQNTIAPLTKGAFAYATKPYNPKEIKAVLSRAVGVRALSKKAETVETALSESEERFRSIVQSTGDAIILADDAGHIEFWNKAAHTMFGYEQDEVKGRPLTMIMPERFRRAHEKGLDQVRAAGHTRLMGRTLEFFGLRRDGSEFPLELSLATWKTHQGRFYGGIIRDITERKRGEDALRHSEERFRQLAENIREVFWMTNADASEVIYISPGYEALWGRTCESLYAVPGSWMEAVHQDDRARIRLAVQTKQVRGEYCEEYRIVRPDGGVEWIRDRAFPIRDESGSVYRLAGIAECITPQKIAEQRLTAQYAVARALSESETLDAATPKILQAICASLEWDIGALWLVDERAEALRCVHVWHSSSVKTKRFEMFNWQTGFQRGVGLPGRVWASGEPLWVPDITRDPNFPRAAIAGEAGLHGALAFPIKLNAQVLGVLEFFSRDVRRPDDDLLWMLSAVGSQIGQFTERQQAEEDLRVAYDKMDAILVSLPCSILIVDYDQRVVYANPLACQHFWPDHATLAGSLVQDVLPVTAEQWLHLVEDLRAATAHARPPQEREFETRQRIYRYRLFPVALRDTYRQQAGIVLWDVTDQRQLQDQLIQAEKLSSLGTLVSGMAHEINNPVQGILGMAEIILHELDPDKVKEYAGDIVKYSEHVGSVVRNFACYARPASRDRESELEVSERLIEAVKLVQRGPKFGHVKVITDFQPVPKLKAHRTEIDQIFVNLISNAVDAMAGKGRLTLSTQMEGETITVRVADTGCGIPKAIVNKIFDPFMTTKDPGKGTGLGLSIVHRIVTKYGGRISVDSQEGQGATFTIQFPSDSKE